jgi:hypothetical protein
LEVPADHHLSRRLVVRAGDLVDGRIIEHLTLGEWAPRLGDDPELGMQAAQASLLEARMQLDLIDGRGDAGLLDLALQMRRLEVRDADRPN